MLEAEKELNSKEELNTPNNLLLDAVGAINRAITKMNPPNKRTSINKSQIKSSMTIIMNAFEKIDTSEFSTMIWQYIKELIDAFEIMLSSETQDEFDLTLREPVLKILRPLQRQVTIETGEYYMKHSFDNSTGDYDNILEQIVRLCFIHNKFLGMDSEVNQ